MYNELLNVNSKRYFYAHTGGIVILKLLLPIYILFDKYNTVVILTFLQSVALVRLLSYNHEVFFGFSSR